MLLLWVNTNGEDDVCISFGCFCTRCCCYMRSTAACACAVALNAIASDADIAVDAVACKC